MCVDTVPTFSLEEYKQKMGFYANNEDIKVYYFENYNILEENYKGEIELYYLIDSFNTLINSYLNETYNNTKDLSEQEVELHFEENKEKIGIKTGITEFDDYNDLVNLLKESNITEKQYTGSKLIKETLLDNERYVKFVLEIYFEDVTLKFNVNLSNINNTEEPIIKFTPAKEEQ